MIMGYSFLDEHVNDIIMNALSNPSLQLVIFTYSIEEYSSDFMKKLFQLAATDHRITIF